MNKLEQKMVQAVKNKTAFKQTNTEVKHCNGNTYVKLYNTYIYVELNGVKYYSDGGLGHSYYCK